MTSVAGLGEGGELGRRDGVDEQEGEARDAAAAGVLESEVGAALEAALGVDPEDGVAEVRAGANLVGEDEIVTSDVGWSTSPRSAPLWASTATRRGGAGGEGCCVIGRGAAGEAERA